MSKGEDAYKLFEAAVGESEGTGEWFEVTQDRINTFADYAVANALCLLSLLLAAFAAAFYLRHAVRKAETPSA